MAKEHGKIAVPAIIRGRSFTGSNSLEDIVLYILESAVKNSGKN